MILTKVTIGPPDGLVVTIAWKTNRSNGLVKNITDIFCVIFACCVDLYAHGKLVSIGFGTLMCMIFVGRIIAVFELLCKDKILLISGLKQPEKEPVA